MYSQVTATKCSTIPDPSGEAEILCLSYGGHLASINSEDENNFIASLMKETGYFWVGGHDIVTETVWQWTDHSAWSYSDWAANEPSKHYSYNCLYYSASPAVGKFYRDYNCASTMDFVCEVPKTKQTSGAVSAAQGRDGLVQDLLGVLIKKASAPEK